MIFFILDAFFRISISNTTVESIQMGEGTAHVRDNLYVNRTLSYDKVFLLIEKKISGIGTAMRFFYKL